MASMSKERETERQYSDRKGKQDRKIFYYQFVKEKRKKKRTIVSKFMYL